MTFFIIIHNDAIDSSILLNELNSLHHFIKFTLEKPVNNFLSFLDLNINFSDNVFHFHLFFKDSHSGAIAPFHSFIPVSLKRSIVMGEIHRAIHRSSSDANILVSLEKVFSRFLNNFYPLEFLKKCLLSYISNNMFGKKEKKLYDKCLFIKLPYYNEQYFYRFQTILRNFNLQQHVKFYYSSTSLQDIFKPLKEIISCSNDCNVCKISKREHLCFLKNVIHKISCNICNVHYIGQTGRLVKTRIHEHLSKTDSAVHQHYINLHESCNILEIFSLDIIHTNLSNQRKRLQIESMYILKERSSLMNGCVSTLLPY